MKKKLLLVDDSDDILETLLMRVNSDAWEVVTAKGVNDAVFKMRRFQFDLIVTDFHMPDGNGEDVLKCFEEYRRHGQIVLHTSDREKFNDRFANCFEKFDRKLLGVLAGKNEIKEAA